MDLKSNEPFWLIKNGIIQSYDSLKENKDCDVLIVGGGITGSLIAHQCMEDGHKTILIDKREIGNGSSSATTSMLQYEIDTPLYKLIKMIGKEGAVDSYHACSEAIDKLGSIAKEIKSKSGFKKKKSLYFAALKKDLPWLQDEFEARKDAGFKVKWLSEADVHKDFNLEKAYGAILSQQGASVDAFKLLHDVLDYNVKRGLQVYDKTELTNVFYNKGFNQCETNRNYSIKAKKIIYCVGYESKNMIKEKFVDLISTFAIVSEVSPEIHQKYNDILIWNTAEPYIYMRTTDDKRILIGGEDEEFQNPTKRDNLLRAKEKNLLKSFQKHLPQDPFLLDFSWAGTFGETKDGLPYIGEHHDFPNSYFVLGFGGNGITFSVTGMEMSSYWLKNKKHKLAPYFSFGR